MYYLQMLVDVLIRRVLLVVLEVVVVMSVIGSSSGCTIRAHVGTVVVVVVVEVVVVDVLSRHTQVGTARAVFVAHSQSRSH